MGYGLLLLVVQPLDLVVLELQDLLRIIGAGRVVRGSGHPLVADAVRDGLSLQFRDLVFEILDAVLQVLAVLSCFVPLEEGVLAVLNCVFLVLVQGVSLLEEVLAFLDDGVALLFGDFALVG